MQQNYPQKPGIDSILKKAFGYWSGTLRYQLLFSLVYFSVFFLVYYYVSQHYGLLEKMTAVVQKYSGDFTQMNAEMRKITTSGEYHNLYLAMIFAMAFLFPLNMGFFQIFRKMDLGEKFGIEDLFVGYNGINFFKFSSFFIFWFFIYQFSLSTIILGIVWVFITLFSAPLMFFMDKRIFETIDLSIKALRLYFTEIAVCVLVAVAFRYAGAFTIFGFLFTFPFWTAMIYTLYQKIFSEKN